MISSTNIDNTYYTYYMRLFLFYVWQIEIPVGGQIIQCIIKSHAGRTITLMWRDARMRDAAVLAFRAFLKMFVDEQKKKKHKWLRG